MAGQHIKDTHWTEPRPEVELEMQNEELSESRDAIEAASRKYEKLYRSYASLFNFTPTCYLVIDRDGVIHEINIAAAILLNAPRSKLTGRCSQVYTHAMCIGIVTGSS